MLRRSILPSVSFALALGATACGGDSSGAAAGGGGPSAGGDTSAGGATTGAGGGTSAGGATTGAGGGTSAAGAGGAASTKLVPTALPAHKEACPPMVTGSATFLGNTVNLWAGPATAAGGPIVLYWHGTGSIAGEAVAALGQGAIDDVTANGGVIASFNTSTKTGQNTGNNVWYTGDFDIADEIVACAIEQLHADPARIHSSGYSAGGLQTGTMMFQRSNYLASVVIYSGGTLINTPNPDPTNVMPMACLHGAKGVDVVIIDFYDRCHALEDDVKARGGFAMDCDDGGPHVSGLRLSSAPRTWQFLKDHPYKVKPEPYAAGLPAKDNYPSYCSIP
jgi:predicted esterase